MFRKLIAFLLFGMMFIAFSYVNDLANAQTPSDLSGLVESDKPEQIATGFSVISGPVWHPGGYLLFSDIPNNIIYKWTPDGKVEKFRSPSGHSNGLAFDKQGRLIACEHGNRRISRTELDGKVVTLFDQYDGKRLNSPNDLAIKSNGNIYFTDPPYGLTATYGIPGKQELGFQGVYRILPDRNSLELLIKDLYRPNGLTFSPDEKVLYVANTQNNPGVYAFDVQPDGTLANRRVFVNLFGWPDGIKTDIKGNLYVTTNSSALQIFDRTGKQLGKFFIPERATDCAFGGRDNKTLFITARTSLYKVRVKIPGVKLWK